MGERASERASDKGGGGSEMRHWVAREEGQRALLETRARLGMKDFEKERGGNHHRFISGCRQE